MVYILSHTLWVRNIHAPFETFLPEKAHEYCVLFFGKTPTLSKLGIESGRNIAYVQVNTWCVWRIKWV
jgi:hypothetical protein